VGESESAVGWWTVGDVAWEFSVDAERTKKSFDGAVLYSVYLVGG
jgi:hypothetical protein